MSQSDDPILQILEDSGFALPPRAIEFNLRTRYGIEISYSTINRRLRRLNTADLVEKEYEEGGYYSVTELGSKYVANELSEEEATAIEDDLADSD